MTRMWQVRPDDRNEARVKRKVDETWTTIISHLDGGQEA